LDPYQGIDVFAFFLPTSKRFMWSSVGINMRIYLYCIYCKVKTRIKKKNAILLNQDVHECGYEYMVANLILLCSLKHISLVETLKTLFANENIACTSPQMVLSNRSMVYDFSPRHSIILPCFVSSYF